MKPGPDHAIQVEKPQIVHFCDSFSLKNRSMGKKQGLVQIAIGSHGSENRNKTASHGSPLPIEFEPYKKIKIKNKKHRKGEKEEDDEKAGVAP